MFYYILYPMFLEKYIVYLQQFITYLIIIICIFILCIYDIIFDKGEIAINISYDIENLFYSLYQSIYNYFCKI